MLLAVALSACRALPEQRFPGNAAAGSAPPQGPYVVQPGDRLEIRFPAYPQWNAEMLVRPDGRANVPLLGDVEVAGRPLDEVHAAVQSALAGRIRSPSVELALREQRPRRVYVGGEVDRPGVVELGEDATTLAQAVFAAGGPLRETARLDSVVLARTGPDGQRRAWLVDLEAELSAPPGGEPARLLPGDVVFVPNTRIDQANVNVSQWIDRMIPAKTLLATLVIAGDDD